MQIKKTLCLLLCLTMLISILSGCGNQEPANTEGSAESTPAVENISPASQPEERVPVILNLETEKAMELFEIPADWMADLSVPADFPGFDQMMRSFISLCDVTALDIWREHVDANAYPDRAMRRDDGLVLLMLGAEALGFNVYNARDYAFCTENFVNFDTMASQLSWDYPYCDAGREIKMYLHEHGGVEDDPIGNVAISALFWMQRRMDLSRQVHFLDCDDELNFCLDQPLSREAAIAAVLRLYNSEMLEYNEGACQRVPTQEDENILAQAEAMKRSILSNTDTLKCSGTAYYVSNSGNDSNDGLTPETAWATIQKANEADLQYGDGVYFERGGLWRGQLWAQEGVTYSAYGSGEKPKIYASPEDGADPAKWSLLEGTDNIWVYYMDMRDCGALVFNHEERFAVKIAPRYANGYLSTVNEGEPFDVKTELMEDLMFFSEVDSVSYNGYPFVFDVMDWCDRGVYPDAVGALYLRCDAGNPGEVFGSIEFMVRDNIVIPAKDTVFHNLCLKYTGFHAIFGSEGFDVSFCEIGWIGGSPQCYDDEGNPICGGNAVECDGNYDHYSVTDCYIYQCFDTGVSHQCGDGQDFLMQNITYARNVITHTDAAVEVFLGDSAKMQNVLIEDNCFLYSGYGWFQGVLGKETPWGAAYQGHGNPNAAENFSMENNVFYLSTGPLIATVPAKEHLPVMRGNTYVQHPGGILAIWPMEEEYVGYGITYPYSDKAADYVRDILGDETGIVLSNEGE